MSLLCSVVIPTYNEKDSIIILIERLISLLDGKDFEIIVADDNSPDQTWKFVEDYSRRDARVRCIRRMDNKGLSPSIVDGFNVARGDFLCVMDGDLQHDESFLLKMIDLAASCDLVIGSRYKKGGGIEGGWPFHRRVFSSVATLMAKAFLGVNVSDPMSGFFVVRASVYRKILPYLNPRGFKILLEILYLLQIHPGKSSFKEIGVFFRKRAAGHSKLGIKVIFNYLISLWQLRKIKMKE